MARGRVDLRGRTRGPGLPGSAARSDLSRVPDIAKPARLRGAGSGTPGRALDRLRGGCAGSRPSRLCPGDAYLEQGKVPCLPGASRVRILPNGDTSFLITPRDLMDVAD